MPRNHDLSSHNLIHSRPLHYDSTRITGPLSLFNPTSALVRLPSLPRGRKSGHEGGQSDSDGSPSPKKHHQPHAVYNWSSRNNRKGRHNLVITPALAASSVPTPPPSNSWAAIRLGLWRMASEYPYWDVSWLVATIFTLGSVVWVINGFFAWLPLQDPSTEFPGELTSGSGITAFIGATIFVIGSVFLMIESVNENRTDCFGWAVEDVLARHGADPEAVSKTAGAILIHKEHCAHHHANKRNFVGKGPQLASHPYDMETGSGASASEESSPNRQSHSDSAEQQREREKKLQKWRWFPSVVELRQHYLHEIGFLACCTQMFAATVFWISGFTALPGILNNLSPRLLIGVYWVPQIIGGSGFIVSGFLFMLETQSKWYLPSLDTLGWHIGFFNMIGGIGFTLCPAFGIDTASWAQYEASLTTFWASWFFLIGSVIQWYESQSKYPVTIQEIKAPTSPVANEA